MDPAIINLDTAEAAPDADVPEGCLLERTAARAMARMRLELSWESAERPGLVLEYILEPGLFRDLETWSLRGLPRPADDTYADRLAHSDPLHAVKGLRS